MPRYTAMLPAARSNVTHALRVLRRTPGLSLTVIASLGISIAAITTVFSLADAVLFSALPFREPGRLVWIASVRPLRNDAPLTLPEYMDYSARTRTVDIASFANWNASIETATQARRLQGMRISANAFGLLGISATIGRLLRPEDDRADAPAVVVLSYAFWLDYFGGNPTVVGQMVRLNGRQHEVVGVLPRYFPLPLLNVDVVVPLKPELDPLRNVRGSVNFLRFFGRIRPSASFEAVRQDLGRIADGLRAEFPKEYATKLGIAVTPMQEFLVGDTRRMFVVMLGASGLLLAIALANVLNLLLVRGTVRKGEMALRRALGASAGHLAVGATIEAMLLAVAGALLGAMLSRWFVSLVASSSISVLRIDEAHVSGRTLLFVMAISILATLLFSAIQLWPALRTAPKQALAAIGRGLHGSRGEARLRSAFLVAQLGFAVLLTVVTATMARSFMRLQALDLGFRPDSVFVGLVAMPTAKYRTTAELARFTETFEASLRATPGVRSAGVVSVAPLSGRLYTVPFTVVGRPPAQVNERLNANYRAISPGYFRTIGATIRAGRDFVLADHETALHAAIVSRAFAEWFLRDADPLGRQIMVNDNNVGPRALTVVGIVENIRHVTIEGAPSLDIYIPMAQVHRDGLEAAAGMQFWTVRVSAAPGFPRTFARVLGDIDKDIALARVRPLRDYVDDALRPRRFSVMALIGFAAVALILAAIGIYGVIAYSVEQRRREIGLRLALGASTKNVARAFVLPAVVFALVGIAGGLLGAWLTRRLVSGLLFGVSPTEPATMGSVAVVLLLTSVIAAAIPAHRASRIDPASALSND